MGERQDFSEIGDKIRRAIQDAVDTGDFGQINDIVTGTVGGAMEEVRRQVNQAHERINKPFGEWKPKGSGQEDGRGAEERDYAERYRSGRRMHFSPRTMYSSQTQGGPPLEAKGSQTALQESGTRALSLRYMRKSGKVAGILYTVFGSIGMGISSLLTLGFLITWLAAGENPWVSLTVAFSLITGGFAAMLGKGCGLLGRLKRAERYLLMAKDRMYLEIGELAARTGQSVRKARRDVRDMLRAGIFTEGHLDSQEQVLALSDEAWRQYAGEQAKLADITRQEQEAQEEEEETVQEGADPTAEQQIEQEGRAYMERLRQLNLEIPGEVISNKLYQLDYLLQRIFMVLKEHPEKCPQMRKFMDYYLPTTVKLVESYADFDRAGVQGDNIRTAKAEIEKTMDTINQAFEKLLDDMYQDAAFEAAADAKVLKTVLAQDGYMKSEFSVDAQKEGE